MRFHQLPFPYADFCVINTHKKNSENFEKKLNNVVLKTDGAILKKIEHSLDKSLSMIIYFNHENASEKGNNFSLISGLARTDEKVFLIKNSYSYEDFHKIDPEFGQYTVLSVGELGVEYKTDLFGAGHLYYHENSNFSIVSNRSHFLKMVLTSLEIPLTINPSTVIGNLFSDFHFFWQMPYCNQGKVKEINLLTLGKTLYQKSGELKFKDRSDFSFLFESSRSNYEDYIDEFCEKQVNNLELLIDNDYFERCILDLTGGKDSRLCLSLLLNITSTEKVRLFTNKIPNSDDLQISTGLAKLLNLKYLDNKPTALYPMSLSEGFNLWRSYFFGEYHRFGIAAWGPKGRNLKEIRISGASGEVYKSIWSQSPPIQKVLNSTNIEEFSVRLVNNVQFKGRYRLADLECVSSALSDELSQIPGNTLAEKIDHHYMYHANRSHFGLRGFSFYNSCLVFTPLLSSSLFKASKCLSAKDRDNYKIFYDLYNKLAPFLINVRFDKNDKPFRLLELDRRQRKNSEIRLYLDESISVWENSQKLLTDSEINMRVGKAKMKWGDYPVELKQGCMDAIDNLESYNCNLLPVGLRERIQSAENTRELSKLYSILYGILDSAY